jgi:hypothetical protein
MVELIIIYFIPAEFIVFNLCASKLANFEFLLNRIILFGRYGFKGVVFSLIALLGINIGFKPLRRVIL